MVGLVVGLLLLLALLGALGGVALVTTGRLAERTELLHQHPFAVTNAIRGIRSNALALELAADRHLYAGRNGALEAIRADMAREELELAARLDLVKERYLGPRADVETMLALASAAQALRGRVLDRIGAAGGDPQEVMEPVHQAHRALDAQARVLRDFADRKAVEFREDARQLGHRARLLLLATLAGVIAGAGGIAWYLFARIALPLHRLRLRTIRVASGDLDSPVPHRDEPSELGEMARAVQQLRDDKAELQGLNAELSAFAHVTAHDLREPLRTINIYLTRLERRLPETLDDEGRDYVNFVRAAARRMNRLILDLRAYFEAGTAPFDPVPVDSGKALAEALAALRPVLEAEKAKVTVDGEMPVVTADRAKLALLFRHLLDNAVKYRDAARPPEIRVAAARSGDGWRITLQDNGIGLPADPTQRQRIFLVFQRLHPAEAFGGGSGIGLALCRRIVERLGGRLEVESAGEGQGSAFAFVLPDG